MPHVAFKGDMLDSSFFQFLKLYLVLNTTMLSAVILGGISLSAPQSPKHAALRHALSLTICPLQSRQQ